MDAYSEIAKYQKKIAALEKQVGKQNRKLLSLPAKFGFKSMDDFIAALQAASGKSGKVAVAAPANTKARKTRAIITAETKADVKKLAGAGKTGAEIAKALNISLPSVQNIKKELGLVKARKK